MSNEVTSVRSEYTAALIDKDLYLLAAVFSSIEENYIHVLKTDNMRVNIKIIFIRILRSL